MIIAIIAARRVGVAHPRCAIDHIANAQSQSEYAINIANALKLTAGEATSQSDSLIDCPSGKAQRQC